MASPSNTNTRKSVLLASYGYPSQPGMVRAVAAAAAASSSDGPSSPGGLSGRKGSISTTRSSHRYSQLYSMAAEQDVEVEDDLARGTFVSSSAPIQLTSTPSQYSLAYY